MSSPPKKLKKNAAAAAAAASNDIIERADSNLDDDMIEDPAAMYEDEEGLFIDIIEMQRRTIAQQTFIVYV